MKTDKQLMACTSDALEGAMREKGELEARIKAANQERAEHLRAMEGARAKLAVLAAKAEEVKGLRRDRQAAIASGQDHTGVTSRIEASEKELEVMNRERSLLEDQEAAYQQALEGCDAYLRALAADMEAQLAEVNRIRAGVLANIYNEQAQALASTVRELRHVCFKNGSYAFEEAPKPHGRYWGGSSLAMIPVLRIDWSDVPAEDAFFLKI